MLGLESAGHIPYGEKVWRKQRNRERVWQEHLTQNQLTELLETEGARALLDAGEERGWIEPSELEAFAVEHDLADPDVEEQNKKAQPEPVIYEADVPSGAGDSLQLFLADVGRHKLLTAAEEVTLAKA